MKNVAQLERDFQSKADAAVSLMRSTMATCEKENRAMTADERTAINAKGDDAKTAKAELDAARGDLALFTSLEALATPQRSTAVAPAVARGRVLTLGEQFIASAAGEFHRTKGHRGGSAWRSPAVELQRVARGYSPMMATVLSEGTGGGGGALVIPDYQAGILPLPQARIVVGDLFAPGTTDSNMISFMQETLFTNAAAPVKEGDPKPESALAFEAKTAKVEKIAHWLPVTEEMLEDVPAIRSYIDSRLTLGVDLAEEDQLLNGSGTSPELRGILNTVGLTPDLPKPPTGTNADALAQQALAIYAASFLMPDGFVLNPANWASTLLLKDGNNQYFVGSPFGASLMQSTLWGLPVAVTPEIAQGTGLVGAFKTGAQIFRHGGIRVESSNSHQDYFIKNLVAIRAEERLALAVYRPSAFGTVSDLDPTTAP